eukprot:jgi/Bigna1/138615/aug1.45_g13323
MRKLVSLGTVYQGKRSNTPAVEDHHEEDTHNILNNVDKISLDTFVERVNLELDSADGGERAIGHKKKKKKKKKKRCVGKTATCGYSE